MESDEALSKLHDEIVKNLSGSTWNAGRAAEILKAYSAIQSKKEKSKGYEIIESKYTCSYCVYHGSPDHDEICKRCDGSSEFIGIRLLKI